MPEPIQCYEILELQPFATQDEIKVAYRDLVNIWHPDRFENNKRLKEKAIDKMKIINEAYDKLINYVPSEEELVESTNANDNSNTRQSINKNNDMAETNDVAAQKSSLGKWKKWASVGLGLYGLMLIYHLNHLIGIILGVVAVGVYIGKRKGSLTTAETRASSSDSCQNNRTDIDKQEAMKLIIENLIILAKADGEIISDEMAIIQQALNVIWPNGNHDEIIEQVKANILKSNDIYEKYQQNARVLSKALDKKEKLEVLAIFELIVKADNVVTDKEKVLYSKFKELLKANSFASTLFSVLSDKCPVCKSVRVNLEGEKEIDRWKGTKTVTEKLASGKRKSRIVNTTYVTIRRSYKCYECHHDWTTDTKEEK